MSIDKNPQGALARLFRVSLRKQLAVARAESRVLGPPKTKMRPIKYCQ
jgi:hypothetical protein